jgi:hypothetical protein
MIEIIAQAPRNLQYLRAAGRYNSYEPRTQGGLDMKALGALTILAGILLAILGASGVFGESARTPMVLAVALAIIGLLLYRRSRRSPSH